MARIHWTVDLHLVNMIQGSSTSQNNWIHQYAALSMESRFREWLEHWQWNIVQYLSAPLITENCGRNRSWWNVNGSSACSMCIHSTCSPTGSHWSIAQKNRWCTEESSTREGPLLTTENDEVSAGQCGWTVANRIALVKEQKIDIFCTVMEVLGVGLNRVHQQKKHIFRCVWTL